MPPSLQQDILSVDPSIARIFKAVQRSSRQNRPNHVRAFALLDGGSPTSLAPNQKSKIKNSPCPITSHPRSPKAIRGLKIFSQQGSELQRGIQQSSNPLPCYRVRGDRRIPPFAELKHDR